MSASATPSLVSKVEKDISWIKVHLLLLAVVAILVFGSVYGVESLVERHDITNATASEKVLALVTAQTNDLKAQMEQFQVAATARDAAYAATIAKLTTEVDARDAQLVQQEKKDATLTAQEAADRIALQTKAQAGEVTASADTVVLDLPVARDITSDLDKLDTLQQDLVATQTQLANEKSVAADLTTANANQVLVINNQEKELADEVISCNSQIAVVKAKARKSKLKWFMAGVVTGFIGKKLITGSW
jgi:hypothetical protein